MRSHRGAAFRRWATARLSELAEQLKSGTNLARSFLEILQRIIIKRVVGFDCQILSLRTGVRVP